MRRPQLSVDSKRLAAPGDAEPPAEGASGAEPHRGEAARCGAAVQSPDPLAPEPLAPGALGAEPNRDDATPCETRPMAPGERDRAATEERDRAFELAYRRLARRDHTCEQIRERLLKARIDRAVIEEVLGVLIEQRYLDDVRYVERFVEDRRVLDGWGAERIRDALMRDGVDRELIDRRIETDDHDELAAALALLERRFHSPPADERARAKALGLLLRRGYESELAYAAVRSFARSAPG